MASNYPAGLDTFDTIDPDDRMSDQVGGRRHRDMHNGVNDAVEAVQAELGTDPSGSAATVAARLDGIESGSRLGADSVGATQIAANAVGASELADNAVDTNAIADGAATPAKLATTGRFVFPTGAANGYGFASGAVHLSGTGAPEGAVTAAPGSTWLQTGSTADVKGWIRWVKATGTGNTGWVAGPEADTGKRNIDHKALGTTTDGTKVNVSGTTWSQQIRRIGRTVYHSGLFYPAAELAPAETTLSTFIVGTYGAGFAPGMDAQVSQTLFHSNTRKELGAGLHAVGGIIFIRSWNATMTNNSPIRWAIVSVTDEAWPTSLPGTA